MDHPLILVNSDVEPRSEPGARRIVLPATYVDAVAAAGGLPLVVPATLPPDRLRAAAARCDGALFIGGADYPPSWYGEAPQAELRPLHDVRAAADRVLAEAVLARDIPLLAICGGHQLLNLACGGRLIQHLPQAAAHAGPACHTVEIRGGRILRALFGEGRIDVNSSHHQAADPDGIGRGLVVTARAEDGTVEALEGTDPRRFVLGVQWHPERHADPEHRNRLFGAFVAAAHRSPPGADTAPAPAGR